MTQEEKNQIGRDMKVHGTYIADDIVDIEREGWEAAGSPPLYEGMCLSRSEAILDEPDNYLTRNWRVAEVIDPVLLRVRIEDAPATAAGWAKMEEGRNKN